ncbi:baseplate wedge protein [Synechococcus phage ACG-2014a]|uniref:Baseplate wedge protein n=1 Tax=Synechococcus phage ACG-2014a TaxID=1493507 RepID=A0A0E3HNP5_9CAUD|nr:baseplate wedge protein [Synechococcus phage ACG-2014a]
MAALLTDQFRIFSAKKFIKALEGPDATQSDSLAGANRDRLYLFIGRPQSWDNENSPPQAVDSFSEFAASYDDMISLKRVLAADTVQVVRRIDWVSPEQTTGGLGFTYDMYRHDYSPSKTAASGATKLYDSDFYVVNSQYQVYKCIYNGTSPSDPNGKPSTVEPTGTSTSIITTGDGYRWKYMYTIPVASVLKFFSNEYMPVFTNDAVKTNAVAGEIDTVVINASGSGYNNGTYDNVAINGDGVGGRVSIVVDGGKIISATVTSGGTSYTFGKISIDSITGIGTGAGGQVDVIIPPPGGHGAVAVVEIGAFRVMINAKLSYDEGDGSNVISGATSGAAGQPDVNFPAIPNTASRTINNTEYDLGMRFNNGYAKPEIESNSGNVVYIDNRRSISRANDQVEDIKIVIEF